MKSEPINKCKALRFFQSIHNLPLSSSNLTHEQLNKKILFQASNLYSYYELIVYLRNLQIVSDKPIYIWRRLMLLIYCICNTYDLYLSKIKGLELFWWNSCKQINDKMQYAQPQQNNKQVYQNVKKFKQILLRNQYLFNLIRCFNIFLHTNHDKNTYQSTNNNNVNKKMSDFPLFLSETENKKLKYILQKIQQILKRDIVQNTEQSQHKIQLVIVYCNYLLNTFDIRKKFQSVKTLFTEFFQSVKCLIKIMKKFYCFYRGEYRHILQQILERAVSIFQGQIPQHKLNGLEAVLKYMKRKQQNTCNVLSKQQKQINHNQKKCIIVLSRIMKSWKHIYLKNQSKKSSSLYKQLNFQQNKNKKQQKTNLSINLMINKNQQIKRNTIQNKLDFSRKIKDLKIKRTQSLRIQKQSYMNKLQIQYQIKGKIQKQFQKINYILRPRSNSLKSITSLYKNKNLVNNSKDSLIKNDSCKQKFKLKIKPNHLKLILKTK